MFAKSVKIANIELSMFLNSKITNPTALRLTIAKRYEVTGSNFINVSKSAF